MLSLGPIVVLVVHLETLCCPSLYYSRYDLAQAFLNVQSLDASVSNLITCRPVVTSLFCCRVEGSTSA